MHWENVRRISVVAIDFVKYINSSTPDPNPSASNVGRPRS